MSGAPQRGFFLVMFAITAALLIAFFALMFGAGFLASNKTQIQNVSNNVALAAMEGYSSTRSSNFYLRSCVGRTRADRVLGENEIRGFSDFGSVRLRAEQFRSRGSIPNLAQEDPQYVNRCSEGENPLESDAAGELRFGTWIENRESDPLVVAGVPNSGTAACGGVYPCFVEASNIDAATQVSAVRFDLRTRAENELRIPFLDSSKLSTARSYGVVVPRCFAGVVDLSYSSVAETHPLPNSTQIYPRLSSGPLVRGTPVPPDTHPYPEQPNPPMSLRPFRCPTDASPLVIRDSGPNVTNATNFINACKSAFQNILIPHVGFCPDIPNAEPANPMWDQICSSEPIAGGLRRFACRCPIFLEFFAGAPDLNSMMSHAALPRRNQLFIPDIELVDFSTLPPASGLPFMQLAALKLPTQAGALQFPADFMNERTCGNVGMSQDSDGYNFFERSIWCNMWRSRGAGWDIMAPGFPPYSPNTNRQNFLFMVPGSPTSRDQPFYSIPLFGVGADYNNPFNRVDIPQPPEYISGTRAAKFWSDYDPAGFSALRSNRPNLDDRPTNEELRWVPRPHESPYGPLLVDRTVWAAGNELTSTGPEPLSRYLSAMNAAFRLVSEQSAAGDRGMVVGFAGDLMYDGDQPGTYPDGTSRQTAIIPGARMPEFGGATADMALLAQLTNPLGRGVFLWDPSQQRYRNDAQKVADLGLPPGSFDEYHPNFIDAGLVARFSLDPQSRMGGTNILKALLQASNNLLSNNNGTGCGPGALKSVVLFSDGINTCAPVNNAPSSGNWRNELLVGAAPGQRDWFQCDPRALSANATNPDAELLAQYGRYYARFEDYLFGEGNAGPTVQQGLLEFFKQNRMSFSAVVDGSAIGATWYPQARPNPAPGQTEYLTYQEIRNGGASLAMQALPRNVVWQGTTNTTGLSTPLANATGYANPQAYAFRKALDTLGRFAFDTGGVVWPILPRCEAAGGGGGGGGGGGCCAGDPNPNCYVSDQPGAELRDCAWNPATRNFRSGLFVNSGEDGPFGAIRCSPLNLSESEQAAYVMISSIGQKPFSLRDPKGGDIN